jgi:aldose sugar dehydrogenase
LGPTTDATGTASQLFGDEGFTNVLHNPGAILVFRYEGEGGAGTAEGISLHGTTAPAEAPDAGAVGDGDTTTDQPDGADTGTDAAADDVAVADELMSNGRTVYAVNCSICHGRNGEGGQGVAFAGNDNLEDDEHVIDTILHGFGYMPPFEGRLSDAEIAAVATYVRNSWDNDFGPVQPEDVAALR